MHLHNIKVLFIVQYLCIQLYNNFKICSKCVSAAKNLSSGISVPPPADAHILVDLRAVLQDLHNA